MTRDECVDLFKRIPEAYHPQVNLVMRNRYSVTVDAAARFEPTYLVVRGREGGSTDEGRAFFVPYDEIAYIRLERVVKVGELKKMYGETGVADRDDVLGQQAATEMNRQAPELPSEPETPTLLAPQDPTEIAKKNLLDRIRATRTAAAGMTGKIGKG